MCGLVRLALGQPRVKIASAHIPHRPAHLWIDDANVLVAQGADPVHFLLAEREIKQSDILLDFTELERARYDRGVWLLDQPAQRNLGARPAMELARSPEKMPQ